MYDLEIRIVDKQTEIGKKIGMSLAGELNDRLRRGGVRHQMRGQVQDVISKLIRSSPTFKDLTTPGTQLYHELGVLGPVGKLNAIIDTWTDSVGVSLSQFRSTGSYGVAGTIAIYAMKADFSDVLGMPEATFISHNQKGRDTMVPWLEWLLLRGRSFVTPGYVYINGPQYKPWSRTNAGIMISMRDIRAKKGGGSWRVPADHAGTSQNNWVTRAILGQDGGVGIEPHLRMIIAGALG